MPTADLIAELFDATSGCLSSVHLEDGSIAVLTEADTRQFLINPVLHVLGYRSIDNIRHEYPLTASGQVMDYLLTAGMKHVMVEAKAARSQLTPKDASQLVGYAAQEGVRWAVLTNGFSWQLFDIELPGNFEAKRVANLDLLQAYREQQLATVLLPLSYLSRESLSRDESALVAWTYEERARRRLDDLLKEPGSSLIRAAVDELAKEGIELEPEDVVSLLSRGTSHPTESVTASPTSDLREKAVIADSSRETTKQYFIFPSGDQAGYSGLRHLETWLRQGFWGVGESTAHRRHVRPGDDACFYAKGLGIVAYAKIKGAATETVTQAEWPGPSPFDGGSPTYKVPLANINWLPKPVAIDKGLRSRLAEFAGKDLSRPWAYLVQTTWRLAEESDFLVLTGQS